MRRGSAALLEVGSARTGLVLHRRNRPSSSGSDPGRSPPSVREASVRSRRLATDTAFSRAVRTPFVGLRTSVGQQREPAPGTTPSSTTAFVALIASSKASFRLLGSVSVAARPR